MGMDPDGAIPRPSFRTDLEAPCALPHGGGVQTNFDDAWLVTLADYFDSTDALKSPADPSRFWDDERGGSDDGVDLDTYRAIFDANRDLFLDDDPSNDPVVDRARWTSYGINDLTSRTLSGFINFPGIPEPFRYRKDAFDAIRKIPRPASTIHFLMMTPEAPLQDDPVGFAKSDHVHVLDWESGSSRPTVEAAAEQMAVNAHGGEIDPSAKANYAFLDGSVRTMSFAEVYEDVEHNLFHPGVGDP